MSNLVKINNTDVAVREYKGKRVLTFKDIDKAHCRPDGTARRNFNANVKHFIEGTDYHKIQMDEIRTIGITSPRGAFVLTESGYLMLAKSFTDDLAWKVQRELINGYFRAKENEQLTLPDITEQPYEYFDKTYKGEPVMSLVDFEYFTKVSKCNVYGMLKRHGKLGTDYYYLDGSALASFKAENPRFPRVSIRWYIVITKAGFKKALKHLGMNVETPKLFIEEKPIHAQAQTKSKSTNETVNECVTALGVLGTIRDNLTRSENIEAVQAINVALKYTAWELSKRATN